MMTDENEGTMSLKLQLQQEQLIDGILFKIHPSAMFALSSCGKVLGRSGKVLRPNHKGYT